MQASISLMKAFTEVSTACMKASIIMEEMEAMEPSMAEVKASTDAYPNFHDNKKHY